MRLLLNWLQKAKSKGLPEADKEIARLASIQDGNLQMIEFKDGTYELYGLKGIGESPNVSDDRRSVAFTKELRLSAQSHLDKV